MTITVAYTEKEIEEILQAAQEKLMPTFAGMRWVVNMIAYGGAELTMEKVATPPAEEGGKL